MNELKIWIDAPTESEWWRLLELHIANGKKAQAKAILAKQKEEREKDERIKEYEERQKKYWEAIPDPYAPNSTEVIE